jgi:hypothetical protein
MDEQYSHTLIALPKDFAPAPIQVEQFLTTMLAQNVVPGTPTISLRVPTGKTREYPYLDPFTGRNLIVELRDRKDLQAPTETAAAIDRLRDFDLEITGVGLPKLPPLPIDFHEPYHVAVTCYISSQLRSTSDPHEPLTLGKKLDLYGSIFTEDPGDGYFIHPHTMDVMKVPNAGCSRFWIEFELGKFLCPKIGNTLELLNPIIVKDAEDIFGIKFVQGCRWV